MLKLPKLLVTCNNFTISLVLPAFDYDFIHIDRVFSVTPKWHNSRKEVWH